MKQLSLFQMTGTGDWSPFSPNCHLNTIRRKTVKVSSYCTHAGFLSLVPTVLLIRTESGAFIVEQRYWRTLGPQVSFNP